MIINHEVSDNGINLAKLEFNRVNIIINWLTKTLMQTQAVLSDQIHGHSVLEKNCHKIQMEAFQQDIDSKDYIKLLERKLELQQLVATELANELECIREERAAAAGESMETQKSLLEQILTLENSKKLITDSLQEANEVLIIRETKLKILEKSRHEDQAALQALIMKIKAEHADEISDREKLINNLVIAVEEYKKQKQHELENKNMDLLTLNTELQQERQEFKDQLSEVTSDKTKLLGVNKNLQKAVEISRLDILDRKRMNSDLEKDIIFQNDKMSKLNSRIVDYQNKLLTAEKLEEQFQSELTDKNLTIQKLLLQKVEQNEVNVAFEATISELKTIVSNQKTRNTLQQSSLVKTQEELSNHSIDLMEKNDSILQLGRDMTVKESTIEKLMSKIASDYEIINDLKFEKTECNQTIYNLQLDIEQLGRNIVRLQTDSVKTSNEMKHLQICILNKNEVIEALNRDESKNNEIITVLKRTIDEKCVLIAELSIDIKKASCDLVNIKTKNEKHSEMANDRLHAITMERDNLQLLTLANSKELAKAQNDLQELDNHIETASKQSANIETLHEIILVKNFEISSISQDLAETATNHDQLKMSFDDLVDRNIELEESVNSLQDDIKIFSSKVISKEQALLKAKHKINEQFLAIKTARDRISTQESELNKLKTQTKIHLTHATTANEEKMEVQLKYQQIFVDFQNRCVDLEKLQKLNDHINSLLVSKNDKVLVKNRELSNCYSKIHCLEEEMSNLKKLLQDEKLRALTVIESLNSTISRLATESTDLRNVTAEQHISLLSAQNSLSRINEEQVVMTTQLTDLTCQNAACISKITALQNNEVSLLKQAFLNETQINELTNKCDILSEENSEANDQVIVIGNLQRQTQHLENCRQELSEEIAILDQKNFVLNHKVKNILFLDEENKKYLYDIHIEVWFHLNKLTIANKLTYINCMLIHILV